MTCRNVLVISPSPEYLSEVSEVLAGIGSLAVFVQNAEGAAHALDDGLHPEIVLLDPLLVGGPRGEEVMLLLRTPITPSVRREARHTTIVVRRSDDGRLKWEK